MKDTLYVIVNKNGIDRTCKTGSFNLKPSERAFELQIEIPAEAFSSPPVPVVRMSIPTEALIREVTIEGAAQPTQEENDA